MMPSPVLHAVESTRTVNHQFVIAKAEGKQSLAVHLQHVTLVQEGIAPAAVTKLRERKDST